MFFLFELFLIGSACTAMASGEVSHAETYTGRPLALRHIVSEIPSTFSLVAREAFASNKGWTWFGIAASTWGLYQTDPDSLREAQKLGRDWGLGNADHTKTVWNLGEYPILRLPSDAGSALYFLGDGWVHMGMAAGFLGVGQMTQSVRAFNTGVEMVHGMVMSTIFNQALKRSTGRESPNQRTEPRGKWRPFPSIDAYNKHTAMYDAMPSGHIMTASVVMTVMLGNYPEYAAWIWSGGVTWLTALGFQMMNNGVHWASDYPLGIAMGVFFGKLSLRMAEKPSSQTSGVGSGSAKKDSAWSVIPFFEADASGVQLIYGF